MSRAIKYRIWNPNTGRFIYSGSTPSMLSGFFEQTAVLNTRDGQEYEQYAGVTDCNANDIYENDFTADGKQILFYGGMFAPHYDYGRAERFEDVGTDWWDDCEIHGNPHENPEFLEDYKLY